MDWKYVMFEANGRAIPVLFPGELIHADVSRAMSYAVREHVFAQQPNNWSSKVVSAGFCAGLLVSGATGKSETLGLSSRPEDRALINLWPYNRGREEGIATEAMVFEAFRRSL